MVRHIVFWKLADEVNGITKEKAAQTIKEKLEALVGVVPGLTKAEVNFVMPGGKFEVVLVSGLESKEALAVYQNHPAHVAVKEFVHQVAIDRAAADCEV